jgi:thiamine biosynthesis lipoprotein
MAKYQQINRRQIIVGFAVSGMLLGASNAVASEPVILKGRAFGSSYRIILPDSAPAHKVKPIIQDIITNINEQMSPYKANSAISLFNTTKTTEWQTIHKSICAVVKEALKIADKTDGVFDPTIGPIVSRFGFGPIKGETGRYDQIQLGNNRIRKTDPNLTLDLCGIAKGYAADQIARALIDINIKNAFIEIGGEISTLGQHPSGRDWQVGIESLNKPDLIAQRIISPKQMSLATSGQSANGIKIRSHVSHIVDPNLMRPAQQSVLSVSVLALTTMEADAFATALCAAGAKEGIKLANELIISALFLTDGIETPPEFMTGNFADHVIV